MSDDLFEFDDLPDDGIDNGTEHEETNDPEEEVIDDLDVDLDSLERTTVNPFFKAMLFTPPEKNFVYTKYHIPFGLTKNKKPYMIDCKEAMRMLIVGITRSGKTFVLRGLWDRLDAAGYFCSVFLTDVKAEASSSCRPVQDKFRDGLLEDEKPRPTEVITFRPKFFKNVTGYDSLPENNIWYSPRLNDLSELDFMTLMRVDSMTEPQKIAMKEIFEGLKDKEYVDIDVIYEIIDDLGDFADSQKTSLRTKFLPLKQSGFFDEDNKDIDFELLLNNGFVPALNLNGFDEISREGSGFPQVFVSIWIRKISTLRKNNKIKPLFFISDEASRFFPKDGNPSCKIEAKESVDISSKFGISWVFATQSPQKMPIEIVNQCKYFLIPYNADMETFKHLFKLSGVVSWAGVNYNRNISKIMKSMKKYEWVLIDRNLMKYCIIKSLSPLSRHAETDQ